MLSWINIIQFSMESLHFYAPYIIHLCIVYTEECINTIIITIVPKALALRWNYVLQILVRNIFLRTGSYLLHNIIICMYIYWNWLWIVVYKTSFWLFAYSNTTECSFPCYYCFSHSPNVNWRKANCVLSHEILIRKRTMSDIYIKYN